MRVRLVSYNVRALRDDEAALVRVLHALDPDVVCVQEAPRLLRWRVRCAAFAAAADLEYLCGGPATGGTALMVSPRLAVRRQAATPLSRTRGLHKRGLAVAEVGRGEDSVVVASMHLGLDEAERRRHAEEIRAVLRWWGPGPVVLAGDVNEAPGRPAWTLLGAGLVDAVGAAAAPTFPASAPRRRIDTVFVSTDVSVLGCSIPADDALQADMRVGTDHLPLVADVEVAADAA